MMISAADPIVMNWEENLVAFRNCAGNVTATVALRPAETAALGLMDAAN